MARRRRAPGTNAALGGSRSARSRLDRVEALLAGESLDTSRLSYDFDCHHVALIGAGPSASEAIAEVAESAGRRRLLVAVNSELAWGWLGGVDGFDTDGVDALSAELGNAWSSDRAGSRLAFGEPGQGLGGWRLSHHQARAALTVALRSEEAFVRYRDVAFLSLIAKDDLTATSIHRLYLEPLAEAGDGGEELRQTLRAYFDADRNISETGVAIGVTRQAVARRLRAAEELIGRPLSVCGPDLELALRFEALEPRPLFSP